ncbi:MAG: hypothetical protein P8X63_14650, partial [Desulfuromonadaceae bacterium]
MDQETRLLFSQQLACWARQAIAEGRSPFRRVDLSQPLLTTSGERHAPLIFWINRESFMAGGILLLPDKNSPAVCRTGKDFADAIGLRHFASWTPGEITLWEIRDAELLPHRTIPLESGDPAGFQQSLRRLMEELKILSVIGSIPPAQLSAHYLANLWRSNLMSALEPLTEEYRAARGENLLEPDESPETLAYHKGAMTLLRLLALTCLDQLPTSVQPENLEIAMMFALDTLPESLKKSLRRGPWELPLPTPTAVRFHHLFRRLVQLDISGNRPRLARALEIFIDGEACHLGTKFFDIGNEPSAAATLLLHPARPAATDSCDLLMEIGSPPLLALLVLLRHTLDLPPAGQQASDVFALIPAAAPTLIRGSLDDSSIPAKYQRKALTTHLRTSWPSRRFTLDPKTPRWSWELLHLLGLAAN